MPRYLTTGKRVAYIRLRPVFASWGDDARTLFETARSIRPCRLHCERRPVAEPKVGATLRHHFLDGMVAGYR